MSIQLNEVEIINFRSIVKCTLNLSSFTPIIGYNNSGKSNALSAIQWLLRRSLLSQTDFYNAKNPVEVAGVITGITPDHIALMPLAQQRQISPFIAGEVLKVKRSQKTDAQKASDISLYVWHPAELAWSPNPVGIDNALNALLPEPIRIGAMEDAAEDIAKSKSSTTIGKLLSEFIAPVRQAHEGELSELLLAIDRRVGADGDMRFAEFQTIEQQINRKIEDLFPGSGAKLHFPVPSLEDLVKGGTLRLFENEGGARDFSSYGHGAQRSVQMALVRHLAEVKRGAAPRLGTTLLLIDEPELYLHPFAVEHVKGALKSLGSIGYQVVFSTHSAQLVSPTDAQFVLLMRKDKRSGSHVRRRLKDAIQMVVPNSVHQMEQLFTISNSNQVLFADRVILTEGKTEQRLLPSIFQSLRARSLGQERCALVAQSGANDTKKSMDILAAMDIPSKAIVDLDYAFNGAIRDGFLARNDPDISALKIVLDSLSVQGKITLGANGFPTGGVVSASTAYTLLAQMADAKAAITSLHKKLLEQRLWLWILGDVEAHLGLTEKSEREWARFNEAIGKDGLYAVCPHPQSVESLFDWLLA